MASTVGQGHTQDVSVAVSPPKAWQGLLPSLVKSAVDQTVKAVTTVVQTEIRALPKQIVAAVLAQPTTQSSVAEASTRRREASDDAERGLSKSQQLWNEAYDGLEDSGATAGIVSSYAETLTIAITGNDEQKPKTLTHAIIGNDVGNPDTNTSVVPTDLRDPIKRQAHMRYLVMKGRDKFSSDSKMAQAVGDVASFVLQARGVIDVAIRNVPQAALPWAGVCVALQV